MTDHHADRTEDHVADLHPATLPADRLEVSIAMTSATEIGPSHEGSASGTGRIPAFTNEGDSQTTATLEAQSTVRIPPDDNAGDARRSVIQREVCPAAPAARSLRRFADQAAARAATNRDRSQRARSRSWVL